MARREISRLTRSLRSYHTPLAIRRPVMLCTRSRALPLSSLRDATQASKQPLKGSLHSVGHPELDPRTLPHTAASHCFPEPILRQIITSAHA